MATSPKAKSAPAKGAETTTENAAPKSKKMLFIIVGVVLILAIGGGVFMFMGKKSKSQNEEGHVEESISKTPVFVFIEPFVVNLQPENGDQFLQIAITLQLPNQATADTIKLFMPQVRSRLLMVLSSKKASELLSNEGKRNLTDEIIDYLGEPFSGGGKGPTITDVFYTSFVIQQQ